jgi:hypothetical protein
MSAAIHQMVDEFVRMFRDTWAECEAHRAMRALEASGQHSDWEQCLKVAEADAEELFHALLAGVEAGAPIAPLMRQTVRSLKSARQTYAHHVH